ncbi:hypothetical protein DPMN_027206 [Dreissena polymorpha]|uniref:Uncharacterized protein n=1 Tax=Dreissena polymorpha TaxID=45954 RepID=A0A9D4LTX5_DREPO|nr:hypothetical protein DPMN_027206 [Dreissena polymorpha]
MQEEQCPFPSCEYKTPDVDPLIVVALITAHSAAHPAAPPAVRVAIEKLNAYDDQPSPQQLHVRIGLIFKVVRKTMSMLQRLPIETRLYNSLSVVTNLYVRSQWKPHR